MKSWQLNGPTSWSSSKSKKLKEHRKWTRKAEWMRIILPANWSEFFLVPSWQIPHFPNSIGQPAKGERTSNQSSQKPFCSHWIHSIMHQRKAIINNIEAKSINNIGNFQSKCTTRVKKFKVQQYFKSCSIVCAWEAISTSSRKNAF